MADRHETVLPAEPSEVTDGIETLTVGGRTPDREAISALVARQPTSVLAWSTLSTVARDEVERYAAARVAYHRGMDALRGAGWGGRGYVRWSQPANRPFLTALVRLRSAAGSIGESTEVERLTTFLVDLDPDWDDANVAG